jgi:hypothetical protein
MQAVVRRVTNLSNCSPFFRSYRTGGIGKHHIAISASWCLVSQLTTMRSDFAARSALRDSRCGNEGTR